MEIPDLVRDRLGDETIETAVNLGDEDVACFTPSRTLVYRGDGLLSDEAVSAYSHDVERLDVAEGRQKVKFVLQYVGGDKSFTVPDSRADAVLERLVDGILGTVGVLDDGESVAGVFRFSELTLTVTDARLVKQIGEPVWDDDFEEFHYDDVTGLSFEEGSVATQIVLSTSGRTERIKAPSDEAPLFRQTLTGALFDYHDVGSLEALNQRLETRTDDDDETDRDQAGDIGLDDGLSPLVGGDDTGAEAGAGAEQDSGSPAGGSASAAGENEGSTGLDAAPSTGSIEPGSVAESADRVDPEAIDAIQEQLDTLAGAVKRQNELLEQQQETMSRLIEELRRGR
jgi:hypothetical protein